MMMKQIQKKIKNLKKMKNQKMMILTLFYFLKNWIKTEAKVEGKNRIR